MDVTCRRWEDRHRPLPERTSAVNKGTLLFVVVAVASLLAVLGGGFIDGT